MCNAASSNPLVVVAGVSPAFRLRLVVPHHRAVLVAFIQGIVGAFYENVACTLRIGAVAMP
jgi:hypothetical protein